MVKINKNNIIFLLSGIIIGFFVAAGSFVVLYKFYKTLNQPSRYEEKKQPAKVIAYKHPSGNKGLYLGFEKKNDFYFFKATEKVLTEISDKNETTGKYSLKVIIKPNVETPGIMWEVFGKDVLDWQGVKNFHLDVYNANEDYVTLVVRIKSGTDYPKELFSLPFELNPLKNNRITIPINDIAGSCDISKISYIKLYVESPEKEVTLFFDNIGTIEATGKDEASDIKKEDLMPNPANIPVAENLKDSPDFFAASSLDRIFQDGKTLSKPLYSSEAEIKLAKNEYESFQVIVSNGKNKLESVSLELSDFKNTSDGAIFDTRKIKWNIVGFVETKKPGYLTKFVGMWPDPLLQPKSINIEPGVTQPFWVTVYASKETSTGVYKGAAKILSETKEIGIIPVTIKVYDFILPSESNLKTAFHVYEYLIPQRTPKKDKEADAAYSARIAEVTEQYYIHMLKNRMNPILNIDPTSQDQLRKVDSYRRFGLNCFSVGGRSGTNDNNWPKDDKELEKLIPIYRGYGETLKFNKMLNYTYIYAWDEGRIGNIQVKKVCSMLHRAYPDFKTMVCYHGIWEPEKLPGWGDDIDIWCFQIDSFNEAKMRTLQKKGIEMWMYVSGPGSSGAPNLAIDFDSIDYRIIPWLCWRYNIKGFLYWCVNWWPKVDPFKSAANTPWEQNGNGLMFYPGEDGPIDSLRVEIFRDGMEDYEYLYLLAQKIKIAKEKGLQAVNQQLIASAEELLAINKTIAISMRGFTKDTQVLMERRQKIAEAIEQIDKLINQN